jgi:hypothetical protein
MTMHSRSSKSWFSYNQWREYGAEDVVRFYALSPPDAGDRREPQRFRATDPSARHHQFEGKLLPLERSLPIAVIVSASARCTWLS